MVALLAELGFVSTHGPGLMHTKWFWLFDGMRGNESGAGGSDRILRMREWLEYPYS